MSDEKLSLWDAVKDNWGQITAIGTVLVLLHLFVMGVMVNASVTAKLAAQDLGTDSKIVDMDKVAAANTRTGSENAEDISQNRTNVEAAFRQLMGMPPREPPDGQ